MICNFSDDEVNKQFKFQENLSVKIKPSMPESLEIPKGSMGPSDKDVMAQLSSEHPIQMSESKVIADFVDISLPVG